jgi:hypothetical protein
MRSSLVVVACAVVAGLSGAAHAQQQSPLSFEALAKSKAGQWAEYTMVLKATNQSMKMRYAIVEKSDKEMALEIDSQTPVGPMLMHMAFEAASPTTWKIARARLQMGAQTQDIPKDQMAEGMIKKNDPPGKLIGTDQIKTILGTLPCKHYQKVLPKEMPGGGSTVDVWMNDKVLPTGMVKMVNSLGVEITLSGTGTDAKPKLSLEGPAGQPAPPAAPAPAGAPAPAAKPAAPATPPAKK